MVEKKANARHDRCSRENQFAGLRAEAGRQAVRSKFRVVRAEAEQRPDEANDTYEKNISSRNFKIPRQERQLASHISILLGIQSTIVVVSPD